MNDFVAGLQWAFFFLSGPVAAAVALWVQYVQLALGAVLGDLVQWFSSVALFLFNVAQALGQAGYVHGTAFFFLLFCTLL